MITKEGSTKNVNFMSPGVGVLAIGCGHISHKVKIHYFFNIIMTIKEGSTKIVNFIAPGEWGSCARAWPYKSYSKNAFFL